jgi:hypothetical protein
VTGRRRTPPGLLRATAGVLPANDSFHTVWPHIIQPLEALDGASIRASERGPTKPSRGRETTDARWVRPPTYSPYMPGPSSGPSLLPCRCWQVEHCPSPSTRHKLVLSALVDSLAALPPSYVRETLRCPTGAPSMPSGPEVRTRAAPRYLRFAWALGIRIGRGCGGVRVTWGVGKVAAREAHRVSRARGRRSAA